MRAVLLGSARALACTFRRPGRNALTASTPARLRRPEKVRDREGAIASTRGACAPQNEDRHPNLNMDWVRAHYDRVLLIAATLLLSFCALSIWRSAMSFSKHFAAQESAPPPKPAKPPARALELEAAGKNLEQPALWTFSGSLRTCSFRRSILSARTDCRRRSKRRGASACAERMAGTIRSAHRRCRRSEPGSRRRRVYQSG